MTDYRAGDILTTIRNGRPLYIRVDSRGLHPDYVYVQNCDAAGNLLDNRGRHLQTTTLNRQYRHAHRAKDSE